VSGAGETWKTLKRPRFLLLNLLGIAYRNTSKITTVLFTRHQATKVCREILVLKIFVLWRPFTQHVSLIFSHSNFRCGYLDNQSEYPKSLTYFCLLILCEWLCAFILLVLRYPIPDKFTRANLRRFNSYRLLTLTKRKNRSNYTFIANSIYVQFVGILLKPAHVRIFSRRPPAKVGSNLNKWKQNILRKNCLRKM